MLHLLRRHLIPVTAFFDFSLVLTYALPRAVLEPLLTPGLGLDTYEDFGFVAIAMVKTKCLRPELMPRCVGQDFFLTGYRIFTRYQNTSGKSLRGLKVLRSDTDRLLMVWLGNALTNYGYRKASVQIRCRIDEPEHLDIQIFTLESEADVHVIADVSRECDALPAGSPFHSLKDARRFAGPLPYTFSHESATNSIVIVKGVREEWHPQLVNVDVREATFFSQPCFRGVTPIVASAFYVSNIPYRWERGVVEPLTGGLR
jgi:hypothetical protein